MKCIGKDALAPKKGMSSCRTFTRMRDTQLDALQGHLVVSRKVISSPPEQWPQACGSIVSRAMGSKSKVFSIAEGGFANPSPPPTPYLTLLWRGLLWRGLLRRRPRDVLPDRHPGSATPVSAGFSNFSVMSRGWIGSKSAVAFFGPRCRRSEARPVRLHLAELRHLLHGQGLGHSPLHGVETLQEMPTCLRRASCGWRA